MLKRERAVRMAVLCSQRAPGIERILHHPERGRLYEPACLVTTEAAYPSRQTIEELGVPVILHPIRRVHQECGAPIRDREARRAYDALTVHVLRQLDVEVVLLLGYLYIATDVLLKAFPGRVLNIHDADLELMGEGGRRLYTGLHSTRDAIVAGEQETRSTLHLVTEELDAGPVLVRSRAYPVAPFVHDACAEARWDIVRAYAFAQREWMMHDAWGEMAVAGIRQVSHPAELLERTA
jgi:folate-dependent phosphoribosylglycinamide formyltransferase PurN